MANTERVGRLSEQSTLFASMSLLAQVPLGVGASLLTYAGAVYPALGLVNASLNRGSVSRVGIRHITTSSVTKSGVKSRWAAQMMSYLRTGSLSNRRAIAAGSSYALVIFICVYMGYFLTIMIGVMQRVQQDKPGTFRCNEALHNQVGINTLHSMVYRFLSSG